METKFAISLFWSDDESAFVALSPEFPGFSTSGATAEEAVAKAHAALALMAETLRATNSPVPAVQTLPKHSGQLRIRIPKSLHTRLSLEAERQGVSLNTHIASLLEQGDAQNAMLALMKAELKTLTAEIRREAASIAGQTAGQGLPQVGQPRAVPLHATKAFPFGGPPETRLVYAPLELRASYTPAKQPIPRVFLRSDSCTSN